MFGRDLMDHVVLVVLLLVALAGAVTWRVGLQKARGV
jgi:hypothetical protein